MSKRILVTGGAGFLGSHLCERLLSQGNTVICVDNFCTGTKENIAPFLSNRHFEVLEHDICFPFYAQVDEIYNLASPASPCHYQENPVLTTKTNVMGAYHLLELAKSLNAKVLQASTSEVYGNPQEHPQHESYWGHVNPISPRACYDEGKRCAETLFFDYARSFGLKIKIARIFNTYGPRMQPQDGRVVSNFIVQALQGIPLTIYGNGSHTRSFCYVSELIDGLMRLMETPDHITGPMNLGNPSECSMLSLAQEVLRLTASPSRLVHCPLPIDDPCRRCPDITLAKKLLGWEPKITLAEGLQSTIEYFSSCKNAS